ncbi:helix-turn-helix domain-containing protein [uncultured Methylobacterium sp.]|uniref:helix-turn-helix domain-containing protein n=1 Tax=uncultured Methylobacterium sp. TaxID=157278 RepID=UPI0035CC9357
MYNVTPIDQTDSTPGGGTVAYRLGDILANRTVFSAQHVRRDRKLVETTPDHFVFQLWRTGGYRGEIAGQPASYGAGTVALANRRRVLDGYIASADTTGLVIPRSLLAGIDIDALGICLDPVRNRLLAARITALYRRLPRTSVSEVPALTAELLAFLRRLLDRSPAADVLHGAELDAGLFALAERVVLADLGAPGLSPQRIADALRVSRATLYRVFAPLGGVMHYVQEQRLLTVRDALTDPLEARTLTRLAAAHGFGSLSLLSRNFRARFGTSPRTWREHHRTHAEVARQRAPEPVWTWWNGLGRQY